MKNRPFSISVSSSAILFALAALLAAPSAFAGNAFWNSASGTSWATGSNWSGGTGTGGIAGSADSVIFDNSLFTIPLTIGLDAAQAANSLEFGSSTGTALGAFTLEANSTANTAETLTLTTGNITMDSSVTGAVTVGGNSGTNGVLSLASSAAGFQVVNNNTTQMLDIAAKITGVKTLSLNSSGGTIRLSGANTFTGATSIGNTTSGTLVQINSTTALTTSSGVTVSAGSAVDLNGIVAGLVKFTLNGTGISGGGALFNSTGTGTVSGAMTLGSNSTIKNNGTAMTVSGNIGLGAFTLTIDGANPITVGTGVISGATGSVVKNGSGTTTFTGANTYGSTSGGLFINNGIATSSATLGFGGGTITLGDGGGVNTATLQSNASALTHANNIIVTAGSALLTIQGLTNNQTFSGTIALNSALTLANLTAAKTTTFSNTITGSSTITIGSGNLGIVAISGANGSSYTGATNINGGTLSFTNHALGDGNAAITFGGNGILQWGTSNTQDISNKTLSSTGFTGTLDLGANNVTFATANGLTGSGNFTKLAASAGILTLSAANNLSGTYTAATTGGATLLTNSNALGSATVSLLTGITTGGVLFDSSVGTHAFSFGSLTGAGNLSLLDNASNAVALTIGGTGSPAAYSGVLSGAGGSLTKNGTGALTLSGANTFTGGVTLNNGTLNINNLGVAGTSGPLGNGGTFTINGGTIDNTATTGIQANVNPITIGGDFAFSTIAGTRNLTLPGNVSLTASPTITVNGAAQLLLASAPGNTISAGSPLLKTITVSGAGNLGLGGNSTSVISDGSGQVGVTMAGTGILSFGGNNSFSGGVLIKSGTVEVYNSSAGTTTSLGSGLITIGDTTGIAAATLQLFKNGITISNNITVQLGSSGLKTIMGSGAALGSGVTVLAGTLTLNDDLTVGNNNGGTGTFTVNTLAGSKNLTAVTNGGAVIIAGNNTGFTGNVISSTGTTKVSTATALSSANTVAVASGATFDTNNQTVTIAGLNDVSGAGGTVTNAGAPKTLTLGGGGSYSFSGAITATTSANMTVTKSGSGTQTLAGTNTYTGATTVNLGTLLINGSLTSAVTANAGTVGGSGSTTGNVTVGDSAGGHDAFIAPGGSGAVGTFSTSGSMSLLSDATYNFKLNGTAVANDKLVAAGVTINSSALFSFTLLGDTSGLSTGQAFNIMHTTSGITGTFSNLAAGSTFDAGGGLTFDVFNGGGGYGNDLYLTVATVPEPTTWGLLAFSLTTVLVLRRRRS